jgi:hypothetical protein
VQTGPDHEKHEEHEEHDGRKGKQFLNVTSQHIVRLSFVSFALKFQIQSGRDV